MDHLAGRHLSLDGIEQADAFMVAVSLHAPADLRAVENVELDEQRSRAEILT